eukprot:CAMPEP_0116836174 /NCGR_PEP_ID=MMETSP0418-20121206/7947_1 /TAXON_ID=1158023 /ORGANISM="Astrosyne radiata, Strain 13vi08-1A" /LENGTH=315 /DNA_ID=CAMNT_0004465909 /DNA_START=51 /DNA_END=998 /DNA_ORIENTATION=-
MTTYEQLSMRAAAAYRSRSYHAEEDTQECANFLLALKHRSVTPEPAEEREERLLATTSEPSSVVPVPVREPSSKFDDLPSKAAKNPYDSDDGTVDRAPCLMDEQSSDTPWEVLLGDSQLVFASDRDLVPDPLFVAMAQMKPCALTEADRVGCYKSREIGFTGMCCKHCGGQPGFGKYFPATVRSLAQTTTSQTILKHVGSKCRFCPPHIRQAVLELQRQQVTKEGSSSGRPRYGSRKVFFQRIWGRLHGEAGPTKSAPEELLQTASEDDSASEPEIMEASRRKHRFGALPTQRNLKRKINSGERSPKRARFEFAV